MNTTPSATPHLNSTTASDGRRRTPARNRSAAGRRHAARARRGRPSLGPRWRRIDRQRLADRRHRRPVRCRAGRDHSRPDHRDVSRLHGRGPDRRREAGRTACRDPGRSASATDWPVGSDRGRAPTSAVTNHMERRRAIIAAAEDAADMRRRMGAAALEMDAASDGSGRRSGASPSPRGCPASTGRNERCSSRRSMPRPVNWSCSTATAESTLWTLSPPAVPAARPLPTGSGPAGTSTAATDPMPRTPTWQPGTHGCWCCRPSAAEHSRRWTGACISRRRSTNFAYTAAESRLSSRTSTPSDCSTPMRWIRRCVRRPLEPATTKAEPCAEQLTEFWR